MLALREADTSQDVYIIVLVESGEWRPYWHNFALYVAVAEPTVVSSRISMQTHD